MDLQEIEINLGFEITKAVLKEAKRKSDLNGIDLYIAFIPSKVRVFYDYLVDRNYKLPDDYHLLVEHEYNLIKEFSAFFNEIDLGFVDVQPQVVQALQNTGSVYPINRDKHPLEVGYRAYAQSIHERFFARDAINQIR